MKKIHLVLISFISLLSLAVAQQSNTCSVGGMMAGTYGYGGAAFGWVFSVILIGTLGLFSFWLIKQLQKK